MNNSQKYFTSRCNELLNRKTFDSYRVSLHNPVTIFKELETCIQKYFDNQIKHYDPTITSIADEALILLDNEYLDDVVTFSFHTHKQIKSILEAAIKNDKNIKSLSLLSRSITNSNKDFKNILLSQIKILLSDDNNIDIKKLNCYTSWLMTELIYIGFSRSFIKRRIYGFSNDILRGTNFDRIFEKLVTDFNHGSETYTTIFKIKLSKKEAFRVASPTIFIHNTFPDRYNQNEGIKVAFKNFNDDEVFISTSLNGLDFKQVIKEAYRKVSEIIDFNFLHQSDNTIKLNSQVLAIHNETQRFRMEPLEEYIDGYYEYRDIEFQRFTTSYSLIDEESNSREKLRSAIRFYKLGNESIELEHKLLNYWIGFEQLFSSANTKEDSIGRIKVFFIAINTSYYLQRRVNYLVDTLNRFSIKLDGEEICKEHLYNKDTFLRILAASSDLPLAHNRLLKYSNILYSNKEIKSFIEKHITRLEQHLTRIYRIRNEIVHEGMSTTNLELIVGHLRHYLLFSIEQITHALAEIEVLKSLDDVFVYYENLLNLIKSANNIEDVFVISDYKGYME